MGAIISNSAIGDADQVDPVEDSSMIDVTVASVAIVKSSAVLSTERRSVLSFLDGVNSFVSIICMEGGSIMTTSQRLYYIRNLHIV